MCSQLGLVSLGYLWLQPQAELLQGMISAGIEAVLVKVAALGLEPGKHLGRSLQQMQPLLHGLNKSISMPLHTSNSSFASRWDGTCAADLH